MVCDLSACETLVGLVSASSLLASPTPLERMSRSKEAQAQLATNLSYSALAFPLILLVEQLTSGSLFRTHKSISLFEPPVPN